MNYSPQSIKPYSLLRGTLHLQVAKFRLICMVHAQVITLKLQYIKKVVPFYCFKMMSHWEGIILWGDLSDAYTITSFKLEDSSHNVCSCSIFACCFCFCFYQPRHTPSPKLHCPPKKHSFQSMCQTKRKTIKEQKKASKKWQTTEQHNSTSHNKHTDSTREKKKEIVENNLM